MCVCLSPIMEQSPADDTAVSQLAPPSHRLGTIVGEGVASAQLSSTSSTTMVQAPPPGVLSFRDHTLCPGTTDPDPEQPPRSRSQPFKILEDLEEPVQDPVFDVPMSPEGTLKPDWLVLGSPEAPEEMDLDAFLSPARLRRADVPMTPEKSLDVSMKAATPARGGGPPLVSDPWSDQLISDLLSSLAPPLTSHPHCVTWSCNLPAIRPRTTITMGTLPRPPPWSHASSWGLTVVMVTGSASLRVDGVLGEGAFATVYQATDPLTSEKMVLKVGGGGAEPR